MHLGVKTHQKSYKKDSIEKDYTVLFRVYGLWNPSSEDLVGYFGEKP